MIYLEKLVKLVTLALAASVAIAGCSKSTNNDKSKNGPSGQQIADKDGNCTSNVISTRNALAYAWRTLKQTPNEVNAQDAITKCEALRDQMGSDAVCTASMNGKNQDMGYVGELKKTCNDMIQAGPAQTAEIIKRSQL